MTQNISSSSNTPIASQIDKGPTPAWLIRHEEEKKYDEDLKRGSSKLYGRLPEEKLQEMLTALQ